MADVLVIGGGMAGAVAALSARRSGVEVTLVRRALGATAMSSGAIDVASNLAALPGDLAAQRMPLEQAASELARREPSHPYAIASSHLGRLRESLQFLAQSVPALFDGPTEKNALCITPAGTSKPVGLAPRSLSLSLDALPEKVAVVELAIDPAFDAQLIAAGIEDEARSFGRAISAVPVVSRYLRRTADAMRTPFELAATFDSPAVAEAFADEVKRVLPQGVGAVLFPPLMGFADPSALERVRARIGLPCGEILSGTPSVPGLRLQSALDSALRKSGVQLLEGEVRYQPADPWTFLGPAGAMKPSAAVLATGKFIGGGIERSKLFREPIFDLPVYAGGTRLSDQPASRFISEDAAAEQPLFTAGIRTDSALRPLTPNGALFAEGLFAAGAVLGGYDLARDKSGLGVAVFTGFLAGESAAKYALAFGTPVSQ